MKRILVKGPGATGPFGTSVHYVASETDVVTEDNGQLVIREPLHERPLYNHPEDKTRTVTPRTTVYARGQWTRYEIQEPE